MTQEHKHPPLDVGRYLLIQTTKGTLSVDVVEAPDIEHRFDELASLMCKFQTPGNLYAAKIEHVWSLSNDS